MHEDKQEILDLLLPALQATRNLNDVTGLQYDGLTETVAVTYKSGYTRKINVAMDSGAAMIRDVMKHIE